MAGLEMILLRERWALTSFRYSEAGSEGLLTPVLNLAWLTG